MGKRYYCDYCDKAFLDNPTNRRNHLNGLQHRTARKLYYDAFEGNLTLFGVISLVATL